MLQALLCSVLSKQDRRLLAGFAPLSAAHGKLPMS
jgi:hypothetical protein